MKYVYVIHPLTGDFEGNRKKVDRVCRQLKADDPDIIPISPLHLFSFYDSESETERQNILSFCILLMELCDEVSYDSKICGESEGCTTEVNMARDVFGIPVTDRAGR